MRRVAIIGLGQTHDERPEDWETWGLPWDGWAPHFDRLFEMHDRSQWECRDDYLTRIRDMGVPVWMQEQHEDLPTVAYPLWAVAAIVGDYFGSSVAYMIALAIYEEVGEIGLWGVDLHDNAHEHQRPNLEYLLGFAKARGIGVTVPEGSALLKSNLPKRYGFL